jgi:nitroreductase
MDFREVIKSRRSLRRYDPNKQIPEDCLRRILEAGRIAPSAANKQPWQFLVVKDPEMRQKLCSCYDRDWLKKAPVILVIVGNKDNAYVRRDDGHNSLEVDLTIAMDHIILAAADEGVGSCWIIAYDYEKLKRVLHLADHQYVSCITPLGYAPEGYETRDMPPRKDFDEIVKII